MKKRGMTLVETLTSAFALSLVFLGFGALLTNGLEGFARVSNDVTVTNSNAQSMRRMTDMLRGAINVSVTNGGNQVSFNLPKYSTTADAVTGEKELVVPIVSDGTTRTYTVNFTTGRLTDQSGRVLVRNIISTDPQVGSSQYNAAYVPFSFSVIGVNDAVTINLITQTGTMTNKRFERFKTTVYMRS